MYAQATFVYHKKDGHIVYIWQDGFISFWWEGIFWSLIPRNPLYRDGFWWDKAAIAFLVSFKFLFRFVSHLTQLNPGGVPLTPGTLQQGP